jgi:hypothetical protein
MSKYKLRSACVILKERSRLYADYFFSLKQSYILVKVIIYNQ